MRGKLGITVLACIPSGGKPDTKPGPDTVLQANAQIIALGTRNQLSELRSASGNRGLSRVPLKSPALSMPHLPEALQYSQYS
ncbi:MAG: TrkA C-terminal domain-containing protein [Planctomycetota bacterium]